ncbi:hypothetical protein [Phosphitispora fastidiosa]|uniref:hypothetical protein n=1 Tax=Phosphitispora fastidiosa TaxID=2837202 RepID=UPI001E4F8274|nr:hypothetical protein [Phosphitispora fastidiosa]MBU7006674.1 hypothetical protein [Phosphitispora fastidiosa]
MRIIGFRTGRSGKKGFLIIVVFCLFIFFLSRGVYSWISQIISAELSSASFKGKITISDDNTLAELDRQIAEAGISGDPGQVKGKANRDRTGKGYQLVVKRRNGTQTFLFEKPGEMYEPETGRRYLLRDGGDCLEAAVHEVDGKSPYGEFLTWTEVNRIFRKFDKARVTDLETGESFTVQRRAGSLHADVQPLTAEDSGIMKKIYGGAWSWKRRAIVVAVKGHRIAASMNGMPHGAGAIGGNDFNGHFCIHFRDSRLHKNKVDLAHQVMVWKAAGRFDEMLAGAGAGEVLKIMLTAVEQADYKLGKRLVKYEPGAGAGEIDSALSGLSWFSAGEVSAPSGENGTVFTVKASYGLKDGTLVKNREIKYELIKVSGPFPWQVRGTSVTEMLREAETDNG